MKFEFATSQRIAFGPNILTEIGPELVEFGRSALVVTGVNQDRSSKLLEVLDGVKIKSNIYPIDGEPTVNSIEHGIVLAKKFDNDMVIGFGGGSALDAGKAIAIMVKQPDQLMDYLEVVGKGQVIKKPGLPYIAIPTTAGTGTEATRNAVILDPFHNIKVSLRSHYMLPKLALIDPTLSYSMTPKITASTGLDAFSQLIEPFVSSKPNICVDGFCQEGILRISRSIKNAYHDGQNQEARLDMSLASLFSGIALANAKLGAIHGIAAPFGGMYRASHGMICASLLPYVVKMNIDKLRKISPNARQLERYRLISQWITGNLEARLEDGIAWLYQLNNDLQIPILAELGLHEKDLEELIEKSLNSSSIKGNPISLTKDDLYTMFSEALANKPV